jgi:hypothetical protein
MTANRKCARRSCRRPDPASSAIVTFPVGEGPAGAAGGGGAADLEPDRRGDGLAHVTRPGA